MAGLVRLTLATVWSVTLAAALLQVATRARGCLRRGGPLAPVRLRGAGGGRGILHRLLAGRTPDLIPFLAVTAAEIAGVVALVALYPQIVPPSVTLYSSAASRNTLAFLVIAMSVFAPLTIAYHAYANWVFRGRQPLDDGAVAPRAVPSPRPAEGGN